MTEPMVRVLNAKCPRCGSIRDQYYTERPWSNPVRHEYPFEVPVSWVRTKTGEGTQCLACGTVSHFLFATEPVPGCGTPYPATERDEDSEYEYAREDAPLLQEDRR